MKTEAEIEEAKARKRAYFRAYRAKHPEYYKEYNARHKAERIAYVRKYRAENPEKARRIGRECKARYRTKLQAQPNKQWEITLTNGMKQYVLAKTEALARERWLSYLHFDRDELRNEIAHVREYGLMPQTPAQIRWHNARKKWRC